MDWDAFIDGIKDDAGTLAKEELKAAIRGAAGDLDGFVREQGRRIQDRLRQLAAGQITRDQFQDAIEDVRDLTREKLDQRAIARAAGARRLVDQVCRILLARLVALL